MQDQLSFPVAAMQGARKRADAAIEQAADATERRVAGWCELACEALRAFAVEQPLPFTIELARGVIAAKLPEPHDLRTWGKVTRMAAERGYIAKERGQFFSAASSNGSPKQVYRRGPNAHAPQRQTEAAC